LTIEQYAARVAGTTRKMREGADPFHAAYVGADAEQRADLRKRWMLGHLEGQGFDAAERILSKGKGAGAKPEHIKAIDRASSDFRYMVVRPDAKPAAPKASMRISREARAAAKALIELCGSVAAAKAALAAV